MMKIIFYVDHKYRDLPSLSKIGFFLRKKNFKVYYSPLWNWEHSLDKDIIVLPKPIFMDAYLKYQWNNKIIIIIETEGCNQDIKFKRHILMPVDLYTFWSHHEKKKYSNNINIHQSKVCGFHRSDFLKTDNYLKKNSIEKILKELKINNLGKKKIVTIATSTHDAHLTWTKIKKIHKRRKKTFAYTLDYLLHVKNIKENLKKTVYYLKKINQVNLDNLIFVLKAHPNENIIFWEKFFKKLNINFYFVKDCLINDLLNISDLHISHGGCTTTIEAKLKGISAAEMQTKLSKKLIHKDFLDLPDYKIKNFKNLEKILLTLNNKNKLKKKGVNQSFIKKYFYKIDSHRCENYAKTINEFVNKNKIKIKIKYSTLSLVKSKIIIFLKFFYFLYKSKLSTLDGRGRYNNRIGYFDHLRWYKIFKKLPK